MTKKILPVTFLLLAVFSSGAQEKKILSFHEENFFTTGMSLKSEDMDIKFRLGFKIYPIALGPEWEMYATYVQTTVWDAYKKSAPFKDNTYQPGLFFERRRNGSNTLTMGIEHRSNGRPYFGNPLATKTTEDYSRGMNYFSFRWSHLFNANLKTELTTRMGCGCGVGDYARHERVFTQDLFAYYLGYFDIKILYSFEKIETSLMVTPILNRSVANVTLNFSFRFTDRCPALFAQFHYGYDEAMCDCTQGFLPPCHLRIGARF